MGKIDDTCRILAGIQHTNWDTDEATGTRPKNRVSFAVWAKKFLNLSPGFRKRPSQSVFLVGTGSRHQRLGSEAEHSSPPCAEVKKLCSGTTTLTRALMTCREATSPSEL